MSLEYHIATRIVCTLKTVRRTTKAGKAIRIYIFIMYVVKAGKVIRIYMLCTYTYVAYNYKFLLALIVLLTVFKVQRVGVQYVVANSYSAFAWKSIHSL